MFDVPAADAQATTPAGQAQAAPGPSASLLEFNGTKSVAEQHFIKGSQRESARYR